MVTIKEPKRYFLLGTAGHIDHGKTVLVRNFTGCETDRLPEEKDRGMSIDLGFASCLLRGNTLAGIVDVPGHEKFIRNMVAGVAAIDAIILVVAADDGVMPQTREHVNILELLGIRRGLVAVTKVDKVDAEMVELVVDDLGDFLKGTFLEDAPVLPLSSVTGEGMEAFWTALNDMVDSLEPRDARGLFRMPVERKFTLKGLGTVATGMPLSGRIKVNDLLELLPSGKLARVRGMQVYKKKSRFAVAGECVAINVPELAYDEVNRGDVLAVPGHFKAVSMVDAKMTVLASSKFPLKDNAPVRFHVGTAEALGRAALLDKKVIAPGEEGFVQLRLESPVVVDPGDRFIVRLQSPAVTVGGGLVLREQDAKLRRFRSYVIDDLREHEQAVGSESDRVVFAMKRAALQPLREGDLVKLAKVPLETVSTVLGDLESKGDIHKISTFGYVHDEALREGAGKVKDFLASFHRDNPLREGAELLEVRNRLGIDKNIFDHLLGVLTDGGGIRTVGSVLALGSFSVQVSKEDEALIDAVESKVREGWFSPPGARALARTLGIPPERAEALAVLLTDRGVLVKVAEDIRFHRDAFEDAREKLVAYLREKGEIGAVSYRDLIGTSRKYAYPLLDYFDVKGVTLRKGNLRYLKGLTRGPE
jgi:selenocysteine-specific elongation factor